MRRWIVRLFLILSVCIVLIIIFANTILQRVALNYKAEIEAILSDSLNAEVNIQSISAQINPFFEIGAHAVTIQGLAGNLEPLEISEITLRAEILPLFSRKLVIENIGAHVPSLNIATKLKVFELRDFVLSAGLRSEKGQFNLIAPKISLIINEHALLIGGDALNYDADSGTLQLSKLALKLAQQKGAITANPNQMSLSGSVVIPEKQLDLTLKIETLYSSSLAELLSTLLPPNTSTTANGMLSGISTCSGKLDSDLTIENDLEFKDLSFNDKFSLKSGKFKSLGLLLKNGSLSQANSALSLSKLRIVDGTNTYKTAQIDGKLKFGAIKTGENSVTGGLNVVGFEFNDKVTNITDSDAKIEPLKINFEKSGAVSVDLVLNGTKHRLQHESIQIEGVKQVKAPLKIIIPKGPGYKISGPVTVLDGDIKTIGHNFQNTSGTIQILISSAEKSFVSSAINFVDSERKSQLSENFKMTRQRYELISAESDYFDGLVKLKGSLERGTSKTFTIDGTASALNLSSLAKFIAPNSTMEMQGKLDVPVLSLAGDRNAFPQSLTGSAEMNMVQTKVSKKAIATKILSALRSVPVVGGLFGTDTTKFETEVQTINAKMHLQDSMLYLDTAKLSRPSYNVDLKGTLAFDKTIKLTGDVIVLEESAAMLGLNITPLKNLFGRLGRIVVPIRVRGKVPDVEVEADIKTFVENNSGIGLLRSFSGGSKEATPPPTP